MTTAMTAKDGVWKDESLPPPPRDQDFGLVVGVDHYAQIPSLAGAVKDAKRFHEWMCDAQGGGVLPEHARLVVSRPDPPVPVQQQVDEALVALMTAAKEIGGGRRLYFHFSGHGVTPAGASQDDTALLLATWQTIYARLALSSNEYCDEFTRLGWFDEVAIFLDCCRTVEDRPVGVGPTFTLPPCDPPCETDTFVAYATRFNTRAFEVRGPGGWQGAFTDHLLNILQRRAPLRADELKQLLEQPIGKGHAVVDVLPATRVAEVQQLARVRNGFRDHSTFGRKAMLPEPELVITFRRVWDGRVWLFDRHNKLAGTHQVGPAPWKLSLPPGDYKLEHATVDGITIEHGRTGVTHVEF